MGLKQDYEAYLVAQGYEAIKPIEAAPPANDDPNDLALLFSDVTADLMAGLGDWDIRVKYNLTALQVQLAREIWVAQVAALAPEGEPV
jgi:hypothetical protein